MEWIDVARGLGILLVALGHTWGLDPAAKKIVYAFHMSVAAALYLPAERLLSRFRKVLSAVVSLEPPRP